MNAAPPEHATGAARNAGPPTPDRRHLIFLPLLALFVIHPLIAHGCSCGHDFDFHLLSWMEAANQIGHGGLYPHWAFTPAWNAGEPRFVFYPPLSWMLGALLGLVLTHLPGVSEAAGWTAAPIVFTWIALTLSGLTMHRLARAYAGANAALIAAALYLANPYMLFTAYERTAYAELLAAAWMPLLFAAILSRRVTIPRIALPIALLWLTNAPAAVMGCYALALLALVRVAHTWATRREATAQFAFRVCAGTALGLALAAAYIVPAAYERRDVQAAMATISGMKIDANFLFEHTGTTADEVLHDQVLHTASRIAVILLAATLVALALAHLRRRRNPSATLHALPILPLAILTAAIALLLTPLSAPLWRHAPEAAFLQFPWRLLAVLGPVLALAMAAALPTRASQTGNEFHGYSVAAGVAAFLLAAALALPEWHLFRQPCDPEDTAPARLALFHSNAGTDPTDEYTPAAADNDALHPGDAPYWLASSPDAPPPNTTQPGLAPMHLAINAPSAEFLVVDLRDYPAWRITLNGILDSARVQREDGLIALPLPAGESTIEIHYARTADQTLGDGASLLALTIFILLKRRAATSQAQGPQLPSTV